MADEICWLIERADPKYPGHVMPNSFLGVRGSYDGLYGSGEFDWVENAGDAIRFSRQKDAAMVVGALASIQEGLPHRETIRGLCSGDGPRAIVVEHVWTSFVAQPSNG
jgi:hypothetical protein